MATGDVACQLIRSDERFEWDRTARFAIIGAALHGPWFLFGFRFVDALKLPAILVTTPLRRSVTKTLITQVTVFPLYLGVMLPALGVLEGLRTKGNGAALFRCWWASCCRRL